MKLEIKWDARVNGQGTTKIIIVDFDHPDKQPLPDDLKAILSHLIPLIDK